VPAPLARRPLVVAAVQPPLVARDVRANAAAHAEAVRRAGARVVVFPELSLTGYELTAAGPVSPSDPTLGPIVRACAETGATALVGAPVAGGPGGPHIATLRVDASGVAVVYRKVHLGGDEPARFARGAGPAVIVVGGWRLGLAICRDIKVDRHAAETAALGMDAYVAGLVHRPDELAVQDARGVATALMYRVYVVFASCAGPTGGGFHRTAGSSTIWAPDGAVLARASARAGEIARATVA
jgi:predicted amidohydrolase